MTRRVVMLVAALAGAVLQPSSLYAWEAKASAVRQRVKKLGSQWKCLRPAASAGERPKCDPASLAAEKLALAAQKSRPAWVDKSYWTEDLKGKRYIFGVGIVQGIKNPSLRVTAAEDRARASLLHVIGTTTTRDDPSHPGFKSTIMKGTVSGTVVDWYLDEEGVFYALIVQAG